MKIACTADWHIHQFQDFAQSVKVNWDQSVNRYITNSNGKEMNSRLLNTLDGLCDLRDYCMQHNITYVLNAGDTFHKRGNINVDTFNAAYTVIESFKTVGLKLISIAGNHDQVDSSDIPSTSIHTLNKIQIVIEQPTVLSFNGCKVVAIPYSSNKELVINHINQLSGDILLLHCGVTGSVIGSGSYVMTDEYKLSELCSDKWKYVVLGHYHRPQLLSSNVFYCGTPVQESFSDELPQTEHNGYNGFYVIDTEQPDLVEFVPIYKPRFITVTNIEDIGKNTVDFFRIKTTEDVELTDQLTNNVRVEIEKTYDTIERSSIRLLDNMETMLKKYAEENNADSDTLITGLNILAESRLEVKS